METTIVKTDSNVPVLINFFDPQQFETLQRVCKMFAHSELVPDIYKVSDNNPIEKAVSNCMVAIDMATRIGASPLMIMQNMIIIYGRPAWSSKFLVATVNTCGRFNALQYKFTSLGMVGKIPYTDYEWKQVEGKNRKVAIVKTFDGSQIENIQCITFTTTKKSDAVLESSPVTIKLAIEEGWYTKNGSKWKTMTHQMLIYRTASFWTSAYAPEVSMGMKTVEEYEDIIDVPYEDITKKVAHEINDKANKSEISFEEAVIIPELKTVPVAPNKEEKTAQQKLTPGF